MEEPLQNPVGNDDAMGAELLKAANAADEGRDVAEPSAVPSEPRASETTEQKLEDGSTPEPKFERPRDELGRFTKTEAGEDIPEEQREPVEAPRETPKPAEDSAYVKAQKERDRKEKTWQELEQRRELIRQEEQRIQQQRAQWEQERSGGKYPASDYEELAKDCRLKARELLKDGDIDGVEEQLNLADQAEAAAFQAAQEQYGAHIEQAWARDMEERIQREPELLNRDAELTQATLGLMQEFPGVFERIPIIQLPDGKHMGGFSFAVEIAKLRRQAGLGSGAEQENKKLKAEIEKLRSLTSIDGSSPTAPSGARRFDDLSETEMEAHLRRASEMVGMG